MAHANDQGDAGVDRRGFLRKAGMVAWTVPAVQVVNMTGALAGTVNTSVTSSSPPIPTTPGDCVDVYYRLKAKWQSDGWVWVKGEGEGDCLSGGESSDLIPADLPVAITGDDEMVTVEHELPDCEIVEAAHKGSKTCNPGEIADGGSSVKFMAADDEIAHVELIIKCCVVRF